MGFVSFRDLIEADIVPIFERIGVIYELRLMMDFSGSNRGFFFVRYTCQEDAKRAAKTLNNYEIQPGKHLGVVHSKDNRKLWISGIPNNHTPEEIKKEMSELTAGVKDVILYASRTDKSRTRSYAFVEYESHRAAALARRTLVPRKIYLGGQEVHRVDWAEPEPEVDCEVMRKVKVLFVRNLMPETTEQQIHNMFATLASMGGRFQPDEVERVKKSQDFGFVHFRTREAAEEALRHCDHVMIDNALLSVSWSKPVQNSDKGLFQAGRAASRQPSSDYAKYEPRSPYLAQMFGSGRSKSQNNFAGLMQPHKARPPMLLPPNVNHSPLRQLSKKITEAGPPFCAARGLYPHQAISPTPPAPRIMAPLNLPFVPQQQPPLQSTHSYVLPSLSCGQAMLSGEAPYPTNGSVGGIALTNGGGSLNGVGYSRMTPYFRGSYWNSGGFPPQGQGIQNGFNGQYLVRSFYE